MSRWIRIAFWLGVAPALLLFFLPLLHPQESLAATRFTLTPAFQKKGEVVTTAVTDDSAPATAATTYELTVANKPVAFTQPYVFSKTSSVALAARQEQFRAVEKAQASLRLPYAGTVEGVLKTVDLPQTVVGGRVTVQAPSTVDLNPVEQGNQTDDDATVVVEVPGFHGQTLEFTYRVFTRTVGVDNFGPTFSNVAPADKSVGRPNDFTFTAEVTDADSSFTKDLDLLNTGSNGSIILSILGTAIPKEDISWTGIPGGWRLEYSLQLVADGVASPVS